MKMFTPKLLLGTTLLGSMISAMAFPIAPAGTEGNFVIAGGGQVTATYEGNSAAYSNDLFLELLGNGLPGIDGDKSNDLFIFNNHGSAVGSTKVLGTFASGLELVFRLHVNNTGYDYYTGSASRNPDADPHARVQSDYLTPGTTLVSFEDLFNGPFDFNDLSFSFVNTAGSPTPPAVPDAASTALLTGIASMSLALLKRKR